MKTMFFLLFGLLLAVLSAMLLVSRRQPSEARLIAHSDFFDGTSDIYLKVPGSHHLTNLTHHRAIDTQPTWSPDGEWIAFVSDRDTPENSHPIHSLYVMRRDGSHLKRLGLSSPETGTRIVSWSPDSQWIYAKYITQGWWDNYFVNINNGATITLRFENTFTVYSSWSPGEPWLAYRTELADGRSGIFRARPHGETLQTENLLSSNYPIERIYWSPSGKSLAFTTQAAGRYLLYRMNVNSGSSYPVYSSLLPYNDVAWMTDNQQILFISGEADGIYIADGSTVQKIDYIRGSYTNVSPSPDGKHLIFVVQTESFAEIYRCRVEGTQPERIYRVEGYINDITWSGQRIFFTAGNRGQAQLYQIRPDGSHPEYLTDTAFDWEMPLSPIIDKRWNGWQLLLVGLLIVIPVPLSKYVSF